MPVRLLNSNRSIGLIALAAAGEMVVSEGDWFRGTRIGPGSDRARFAAFDHAEQMLRDAMMPALVFERRATDAQVREAFRRINLGGSPIEADALERLLGSEA
jgi:hypothetical protein